MEGGPDKLTKPVSSGPLIRRPPTDSKRPWLDWKRDEPSPHPKPARTKKKVSSAYLLFFLMNGVGAHRLYLGCGKAAVRWIFSILFIQFPPAFFSVAIEDKALISDRIDVILLVGLWIPFFYVLYVEFKTIRPNVEAYNKDHNL